MFAAERRQLIVDRVRAHGPVSLGELAQLAESSEATIRRDLRILATQGVISRSRGGAAMPSGDAGRPGVSPGRTVSADDRAIGELAATMVDDGDSIVLGAGSTAQQLAYRLRGRTNLTVVTNSILVCEELADANGIDVVMTGGSLRGGVYALVGSEAEHSLAGLRVRLAFLSGGGLTAANGLSTSNMALASVDRAFAATAHEVFVMADHTKLGTDAMFQTVAPARISRVITDGRADTEVLRQFGAAGITTHVARLSNRRSPAISTTFD